MRSTVLIPSEASLEHISTKGITLVKQKLLFPTIYLLIKNFLTFLEAPIRRIKLMEDPNYNLIGKGMISKLAQVPLCRGDIYYADLSPIVGCEQGGVRPVLIIQNKWFFVSPLAHRLLLTISSHKQVTYPILFSSQLTFSSHTSSSVNMNSFKPSSG